VSLNKRLVSTTSVAALVLAISFFTSVDLSFGKDIKAPLNGSSLIQSKSPVTSTTSLMAGCVKTNSIPHYPIKLSTGPDYSAPQIDRTFTLDTNCGQIVFKTFAKKAPNTVAAMSFLAKSGFFNHSLCHRLTTAGIYVLQCGDPTASGQGGPLFSYDNENVPASAPNNFRAGTIAMANAGLDANGHGTNGSQFFIVYKDSTLIPPDYTIWGVVTKGLDIVKKIAAVGVLGGATDGTPKQTIAIETVLVK